MVLIYSEKNGLYFPEYQLLFKEEPLETTEKIAKELTKDFNYIKYYKGKAPKPKKEITIIPKEIKTGGGSFKKY